MYLELHPLWAFGGSALIGFLTYVGTRIAVGKLADKQVAAIFVAATLVSPWWAALAGAIFGHVFAMVVARAFAKEAISDRLRIVSLLVPGLFIVASLAYDISMMRTVVTIVHDDNDAKWAVFAKQTPAHSFVAKDYRGCIETQVSSPVMSNWRKTDPLVCKSSAISLARAKEGDAYADKVRNAIEEWSAGQGKLTAAADQRLAAIARKMEGSPFKEAFFN